jgi:hypothetical protein
LFMLLFLFSFSLPFSPRPLGSVLSHISLKSIDPSTRVFFCPLVTFFLWNFA